MQIGTAVPGQRLVSDSEPELGLGILLKAQFGRVEVFFPAANEHRQYALQSAPLRRVQFKEGDRIKLHSGEQLVVDSVEDRGGLLIYRCAQREVAEAELSDSISFSTPEDRLLGGQIDESHLFDLRVQALQQRCTLRKSPVRGYVGGRVDLIPHQIFIAGEVANRLVPRVLLADEVGLGKTIEAGLILHRLHRTGRAGRILILLPEPLIHQWFVELWRRFDLLFSIFDEDRCQSIELNEPGVNPFLDSQLVLCSLAFLSENPARTAQALDAGWDLLIVDEAHHLEWHPDQPGVSYRVVEALAAKTPGLLLLTATPQQLGPESHFARLRLLDPERYASLDGFLKEAEHYERVAKAVDRLLAGNALAPADRTLFGTQSPRIRQLCEELQAGTESARASLITELLDSFGIGRVMFRNTRAALTGFPERKAVLSKLKKSGDEFQARIQWLAELLKELGDEKALLICQSRALAERIAEALQRVLNVPCGLFHEDLTLMQRDRNAAYFAEPDGARILICSEIGSEGRNFQFAHHLVLFDLPANPELLEQRIGRLDRIGQSALIQIHVPYVPGTESEVLARWYYEGLGAFEKNLHGAMEIAAQLRPELEELRAGFDSKKLTAFLKRSRQLQTSVARRLERGHDRLLELNSCRPEVVAPLLAQIRAADEDPVFEEFFLNLLDHCGVQAEDLGGGHRSYLLRPGPLLTQALPGLTEEGLSVTFQRNRALSREDVRFMSGDHPMVQGALDQLLSAENGNACFGVWKGSGQESILLEAYAVVECVAPAALHVDRFLPATPIRTVINHEFEDVTEDPDLREWHLEKGDIFKLLDKGAVKRKLLPAMLEKARTATAEKMTALVAAAQETMHAQLQGELDRLEDLRSRNDHVRVDEIEALTRQKAELQAALSEARPRLDALRLILRI
jgi:ATP-dependent helicase HepA